MLGDIHKLVLNTSSSAGGEMYNTFWFREEVAGLPGDPRVTLANDFMGVVVNPASNGMKHVVYNLIGFNWVRVQRMFPYQDGSIQVPFNPVPGGLRAGRHLPQQCAQCITIYTARPGRRGRGRWYLPPPAAEDQSAGSWTPTQLIALGNMMTTINGRYGLAGGYTVSGFRLGVWSKLIAGPSPPFVAVAFEPITGWIVRPDVRTVRRRSLSEV